MATENRFKDQGVTQMIFLDRENVGLVKIGSDADPEVIAKAIIDAANRQDKKVSGDYQPDYQI